jgi:hypothetical protein
MQFARLKEKLKEKAFYFHQYFTAQISNCIILCIATHKEKSASKRGHLSGYPGKIVNIFYFHIKCKIKLKHGIIIKVFCVSIEITLCNIKYQ